MIDPLWLKAVLKALLLPPTGPLLLAMVGICVLAPRPRAGRALAATGVLVLLAISTPIVASLLTRVVDTSTTLDLDRLRDAKAIVILGSGMRRNALEYGGDTLGSRTLERVRYGAFVARRTGLPVLVSGGAVLGAEPEANAMRTALESEFGVPVHWIEPRSRTTHENAVMSADLLRGAGIRRVLLVAHAVDMRRAAAEFAAQGIEVVPAPTGKHGDAPLSALDFVPSMAGLVGSYFATYEIVANLVFAVSGGH